MLIFKGEPEYVKFWNEFEMNPDSYQFPTIEAALKELQNKPKSTIYLAHMNKISAFYHNSITNVANYKNLPEIKVIKDPMVTSKGIL